MTIEVGDKLPDEEQPKVEYKEAAEVVKLDKHGLALDPQPSDDPNDPLNWPRWKRVYLTLLVSALGFTAQFGGALINPSLVLIAKSLHVTVEQASYCTTLNILFAGVLSMPLVPIADVYGRRICFVIFTLVAAIGAYVSATGPSYGAVITGRAINGIGGSVPLGLGAATICDLFTSNERGFYMGIYTLSVTNGPHVAPIIGGYVAERLGWRWCFWIPGFMQIALWVAILFTFPETLYIRNSPQRPLQPSYFKRMIFVGKYVDRKLRIMDVARALRMARYVAVIVPVIWYGTANAYGSVLFAITGSLFGTTRYHFDIEQVGLFLGIPLTIGCMLGEASAGWLSDLIVATDAKRRRGGQRKAEARLYLLPLCTLLAIGTSTYGYMIEERKPWIDAAVCMAVSGFGCQVGTTMIYTYTTDCYKAQSGEVGAVINLFKSSEYMLSRPYLVATNYFHSSCLHDRLLCASIR